MNTAMCPKQLGTRANRANESDRLDLIVEVGDVILLGSDGTFDNTTASYLQHVACASKRSSPLAMAEEIEGGVSANPITLTLTLIGGDIF